MNEKRRLTRRNFVKAAAACVVGPAVIPSSALGLAGTVAPSNRIAMGFIGLGGRGTGGMRTFLGLDDAQVVAVCDVDRGTREGARDLAKLPEGAAYSDFRELLARPDVDAVQIATPDHWHVLPAIAAAKSGRDVYCEKPLSNTIAEGRALVDAVERYGTVFQHGTQLRSLRNVRFACELVRNGRIGTLQTITIGSPPGHATGAHPPEAVPEGLDYALWQGPAPRAPYTPWRVKVPGELPCWYFISDYSKSGWIAGYGVHDIDIAHWGMDTEHTGPVEVEGEGVFPASGLFDTVLTYRLRFTYANGVVLNMTSTDLNPHGVRFEGTKGWVFTRGGIDAEPKSLLQEVFGPGETHLYESTLHERNFLDCVKSRARTITPAEVAHRSTTVGLLGGIALTLGRKLRWDPQAERFVDDAEADRLLSYTMRAPWRL
ncbi:MAG: Gfo/Idh/MocA family oxidoreductase [Candidatus Hydrogenedentes bacterium]|nr:Gfo/Idh/MocA family oxidoreductase [Candidatus Hydrogenedentota bacterium]